MADQSNAIVPGFAGTRVWADASAATIARQIGSPRFVPTDRHDVNLLALSGGGAGGAFTAGLLRGWSEKGGRPSFDVVTGVSTGALIAPFAFLGSSYDDLLQALYTGPAASDLATLSLPSILTGSGLVDPQTLKTLIARYATPDLLEKIAAEHRRGRRLLVVTTNLDAQRPVLWDLGAIAATGRPDALSLFCEILLASASIPAVYPPVMVEVEGGVGHFSEMHVDGGTAMQVFADPDILLAGRTPVPQRLRSHIHLWVVINNTLPPEFSVQPDGMLPVALRSFSTLMKSQTTAIVAASAEASRRLGVDFNVAYIDRALAYNPKEPFAPAYMNAAFGVGEAEARAGAVWRKPFGEAIAVAGR